MARIGVLLATAVTLGVLVNVAPAQADVRVTSDDSAGSYARYDGGTDAVIAACSTSRRPQNEPTVAIDPRAPQIVTAGSNDYCAQATNAELWVGYYRSTDGGQTWQLSLVPGYPGDDSPAGLASPTHGSCAAAGDPTQSFDGAGNLYYGFICFNRAHPQNGSVYVATYGADGAQYVRTVRIATGAPGNGTYQDKINVVADPAGGNVYVAWVRYSGSAANNVVYLSRSTDHGATFSAPARVTKGLAEEQFADMAVAPDGTLYLTYRTIAHQKSTHDAIWLTRSTDGGTSFGKPREVAAIEPFDSSQFTGNGAEDCGDGPFACPTGFTFSRFSTLSAVAADASGAHVVWSARRADGQAKIFVRNSPDGVSFPDDATTIDGVPNGHQWFPDIASAGGTLSVIFYDSRADLAYAPQVPPGNTAGGVNSGDVVDAYLAQSTDGGGIWSEAAVSSARSNFGWETHGARRLGFWGDYLYVAAAPGAVNAVWMDSRDLVAGTDPREPAAVDGFDVFAPCTYTPNDIDAASYASPSITDPCLNLGGLDQNVYGVRLP